MKKIVSLLVFLFFGIARAEEQTSINDYISPGIDAAGAYGAGRLAVTIAGDAFNKFSALASYEPLSEADRIRLLGRTVTVEEVVNGQTIKTVHHLRTRVDVAKFDILRMKSFESIDGVGLHRAKIPKGKVALAMTFAISAVSLGIGAVNGATDIVIEDDMPAVEPIVSQ